ncbi:MAG: UDP-N-acetylglucosamine 4,6-dehydratase (inverting) [Bacteroidales bacterium]
MINGGTLLITGGTGSFGKKFIKTLINNYSPKKIIVYSRDELKQFEMQESAYFKAESVLMRYFIGDVRDLSRLEMAMEGVDIVVHAAALKQVPAAEYNPFEAVKTNILGAQNVLEACLKKNVKRVVALSTDKAAAPINLYGATKLASDKLFVAANNMKGARDIRFSVVRYGNVMGSRGSVIPFFEKKKREGFLPITDERMTRFNITLEEGVSLVLYALENAWGGEIFVPKIPSYRILDVAEAIAPGCEKRLVGIRPGEKIHEEMITESDSFFTYDLGKYYAILPQSPSWDLRDYLAKFNGVPVEQGFKYNSGTNPEFLNVQELRNLIQNKMNE